MENPLNIQDILELLPHRYPFLLVDRVLDLQPGERIVGLKNITFNEEFFQGHFPGQPVMPGVLIIESMAQVAGLMILSVPEHRGKLAYIGAIENVRFRKPALPGDTLITEAHIVKLRGSIGKVRMTARVEGVVVAECQMTFALMERTKPNMESDDK